jgi:hypothetical protein
LLRVILSLSKDEPVERASLRPYNSFTGFRLASAQPNTVVAGSGLRSEALAKEGRLR